MMFSRFERRFAGSENLSLRDRSCPKKWMMWLTSGKQLEEDLRGRFHLDFIMSKPVFDSFWRTFWSKFFLLESF